MGNTTSSSSKSSSRHRSQGSSSKTPSSPETAAERAKKVVGDLTQGLTNSVKKLEETDNPAAQLIDTVCGSFLEEHRGRSSSFYSDADEDEDEEEDYSRISEDDSQDEESYKGKQRRNRRKSSRKDSASLESQSFVSDYDESERSKLESEDESAYHKKTTTTAATTAVTSTATPSLAKPLASSFAKRCYFTKAGIGKTTQHYEGLTLTGNIVLMLSAAMKLKGCPTICDEDLRRVEQTYPNQFSRLPDELLLSSGWRRISKYCHFSSKPIPDGVPFFHSKQRLHPTGGYYFLLAGAVGMVRPIDVEPLTRDTLVLLETDYPSACDAAPKVLIEDPAQWTLVNKFCFFSGGPINTEEDVYYQADFDGNPIYMLAFLSPSLTPEELYKLDGATVEDSQGDAPGLKTVQAVEEVESVYDLTERDFDDLKLYHLGPCRALPQYILQPHAWTKVLPPHFLAARQKAMLRAQAYTSRMGAGAASDVAPTPTLPPVQPPEEETQEPSPYVATPDNAYYTPEWQEEPQPQPQYYDAQQFPQPAYNTSNQYYGEDNHATYQSEQHKLQREVEEEGAFIDNSVPIDEALASRVARSQQPPPAESPQRPEPSSNYEPPEDEPPSLSSPQEGEYAEEASPRHHYYDAKTYQGTAPNRDYGYMEQSYPSEENLQQEYFQREDEYYDSPENKRLDKNGRSVEYYEGNPYNVTSPVSDSDHNYSPRHEGEDDYYGSPDKSEGDTADYYHPGQSGTDDQSYSEGPDMISPRSQDSVATSDYSHSSAMRGAQQLLRLNRQKRLQRAIRKNQENSDPLSSPYSRDDESNASFSGSEMTSVISGSSVWTDGSTADRSSRRALILQMAKARMKSNKERTTPTNAAKANPPIAEETSQDSADETRQEQGEVAPDIDLTGDLD